MTPQEIQAQLLARKAAATQKIKNNRAYERQIRAKEMSLGDAPPASTNPSAALYGTLASMVPAGLMPGNLGDLPDMQWGYFYEFDFDFGTNPALTPLSRLQVDDQVNGDSGFYVTGISQNIADFSDAGALGPYQIQIQSAQSTRQFTSQPIPLQSIGSDGRETQLDIPILFFPNDTISIIASTWLQNGETSNPLGSSAFQVSLFGLRVRVQQ